MLTEAVQPRRVLAVAVTAQRLWRAFAPPVRNPQFWIVQGGVLGVIVLDEWGLDTLGWQLPLGIPRYLTISLLFVPLVYAALNFGTRGSIATAAWATTLMLPDWTIVSHGWRSGNWGELVNVLVLNGVAIIVGQRVEHERTARAAAVGALQANAAAEARYHALFEEQHAPVFVVDERRVVSEANAAASQLLGVPPTGRHIGELLGLPVEQLLDGSEIPVTVENAGGEVRLFVPRGQMLQSDGHEFLQLVLVDVTEQHRRQVEEQAYAARLTAAQEEERRRIARELHDDPLQTQTFLVRSLEELALAPGLPGALATALKHDRDLADEVGRALREVICSLRPPLLDDLGLVPALRAFTADVRVWSGVAVALRIRGEERRLASGDELALYRVAQEALVNAMRHAAARHIQVMVDFRDGVVLRVRDNGCGFIPGDQTWVASTGSETSGLGLIGMRERMTQAGGSLRIHSRPGQGTVVDARLPESPGVAGYRSHRPNRVA